MPLASHDRSRHTLTKHLRNGWRWLPDELTSFRHTIGHTPADANVCLEGSAAEHPPVE